MSKRDEPPLIMTVENRRLVPATPFDQEALDRYPNGSQITVTAWKGRNPELLRKYWWIIGCIVKNAPTPWRDDQEASDALKLALGKCRIGKDRHGKWFASPDSVKLTAMEDPEFKDYFDHAMAVLAEVSGVDPVQFTEDHTRAKKQISLPGASDLTAPATAGTVIDVPATKDDGGSPPPPSSTPNSVMSGTRQRHTAHKAGDMKVAEVPSQPSPVSCGEINR